MIDNYVSKKCVFYVSEDGAVYGTLSIYKNYIEFQTDERGLKKQIILYDLIKNIEIDNDTIFVRTTGQYFVFKGDNMKETFETIKRGIVGNSVKYSQPQKIIDAASYEKWSIYSILSFVLSIIGGVIPIMMVGSWIVFIIIVAALIMGIRGIVEINKNQYKGMPFAIIGIVISALSLIGLIYTLSVL